MSRRTIIRSIEMRTMKHHRSIHHELIAIELVAHSVRWIVARDGFATINKLSLQNAIADVAFRVPLVCACTADKFAFFSKLKLSGMWSPFFL